MAGSGVYRKKLAEMSPKTTKGIREMVPQTDISGLHPVEYRDDSVLRKDVHPNTWAPEGQNPRAPYPVVAGQGYHRVKSVVGPRAKEPIYAPDKFRPFGSSMKSARNMSIDTDQDMGVHLQAPPLAAELVDHDQEGPPARKQAKKSGRQGKP